MLCIKAEHVYSFGEWSALPVTLQITQILFVGVGNFCTCVLCELSK
jgi:hypothetical protein